MLRAGYAVALFCAVASFAQTPSLPPLSERIEVNLVNVDVTVLDRDGQPVPGLTAQDFELLEDNVPQAITNFDVVNQDAKKNVTSTDFDSDPERRRSVVVFVDNRELLDKPRGSAAVAEIEHFLERAPDDSKWSIVTLRYGERGFETALPLTSDRSEIHAALDAIAHGGVAPAFAGPAPMNRIRLSPVVEPDCPRGGCMARSLRNAVSSAQDVKSRATFFEAVIATVRGLAWMPGKKAMLVLSADVPGYTIGASDASEQAASEARLHDAMVREANAANVNLFVIDPNGPSKSRTSAAVWMSALTGGLFMPSNRLDESVAKFDAATRHYYALGYHSNGANGKYHRIAVELKRPGKYTLLYRKNFLKLSHDQEFERALGTPFGIAAQKSTLPLTLTVQDPKRETTGNAIVPMRIAIPMSSATFIRQGTEDVGRLHVYISVFNDLGDAVAVRHFVETITDANAADKSQLIVERGLRLSRGTYRIFVTIRDELSDRVGVVAKEVRL